MLPDSTEALSSMLLLAWWAAVAPATEYVVEGPPKADRAEAVAVSRAVREQGHDARVVRRSEGSAWVYVVQVADADDLDGAVSLAGTLSEPLGGSASVYRLEDPDGERVLVWSGTQAANGGVLALAEELAIGPTIRAHGGLEGGLARLDAAPVVVFRFRRTLPTGEVVDHRWARQGDKLSVEVQPVSGAVVPSRTLVTPTGAWLATRDGGYTAQDRERTLETISAFAPDRVVPFVLTFAALAQARREISGLSPAGEREEEDGQLLKAYSWAGDQAAGALDVEVDARTHLVHRVSFEGGAKVVAFSGWMAADSAPVVLPREVKTWRDGQLVDQVEILEIALPEKVPNEWFEAPAAP